MATNRFIASLAFSAAACLLPAASMAADAKPTIFKPCMQCHTAEANALRGQLGNVSMKAQTIKLQVGPQTTWLVSFDDDTQLVGAEALNKIKAAHEILIRYTEEDDTLLATSVHVKKPAEIPAEQIMKVDDLKKLVALGPEEGQFTLVDARPGKKWLEGHIAGSISMYDAQFDKNVDKLPKAKDALLVFYCGGPT